MLCLKSVPKQIGDRQSRFKKRKPLANRRHDDTLVLANSLNDEWTRKTYATLLQASCVPSDVIDTCQNHGLSGSRIRRYYLRCGYADEKREA